MRHAPPTPRRRVAPPTRCRGQSDLSGTDGTALNTTTRRAVIAPSQEKTLAAVTRAKNRAQFRPGVEDERRHLVPVMGNGDARGAPAVAEELVPPPASTRGYCRRPAVPVRVVAGVRQCAEQHRLPVACSLAGTRRDVRQLTGWITLPQRTGAHRGLLAPRRGGVLRCADRAFSLAFMSALDESDERSFNFAHGPHRGRHRCRDS